MSAALYLKDPATAQNYEIEPGSVAPRGSHDGLECRWQDIPSRYGETVSLMVRALDPDAGRAAELYRAVIARVREIYGDDGFFTQFELRSPTFL